MRSRLAPLAALSLAALSLAACGPGSIDAITFTQDEALPGFAIRRPTGTLLRERRSPAAGELVMRKRSAVLAVSWQAGRVPPEDLPTFAKTAMEALGSVTGGTTVEPLPLELPAPDYGVELLTPTDKRVIMVFSLIQCAHANVTVSLMTMATADREGARRFHERLRSTVRCRQDGPALGVAAGLPAFTLAEHIAYLPDSDPPSYYALTGERWYVTPSTSSQQQAFERPEVVARMFSGLGLTVAGQERLPDRPGWMRIRLDVEVDGERGQVLLGALTCADGGGYTVVHMNSAAFTTPLDPAELERVACPTTPVDAAGLPTVPARFGAACDGGDAGACLRLAELVDEEPARLTGVDAAKLRARACALGVRDACE